MRCPAYKTALEEVTRAARLMLILAHRKNDLHIVKAFKCMGIAKTAGIEAPHARIPSGQSTPHVTPWHEVVPTETLLLVRSHAKPTSRRRTKYSVGVSYTPLNPITVVHTLIDRCTTATKLWQRESTQQLGSPTDRIQEDTTMKRGKERHVTVVRKKSKITVGGPSYLLKPASPGKEIMDDTELSWRQMRRRCYRVARGGGGYI